MDSGFLTNQLLGDFIKTEAKKLGFYDCGFSKARKLSDDENLGALTAFAIEERLESLVTIMNRMVIHIPVKNNNSNQEDILKNIPEKRFHYFKVNNGELLTQDRPP